MAATSPEKKKMRGRNKREERREEKREENMTNIKQKGAKKKKVKR